MEEVFTKDQVKQMMLKAFKKGEQWGVTYSTWFIPSKEETKLRATEDCEEIYKNAIDAIKTGGQLK